MSRFAIEFFLFLVASVLGCFGFVRLLNSSYFTKLLKGAVPPAESDDEILESVTKAEHDADTRAELNEAEAARKTQSAKKLRGRKSVAEILSDARKN